VTIRIKLTTNLPHFIRHTSLELLCTTVVDPRGKADVRPKSEKWLKLLPPDVIF